MIKDVIENAIFDKPIIINAILPNIVFRNVVPVANTSVFGVKYVDAFTPIK